MKPFVAPVGDTLFSLQVAGARRLEGWDEGLAAEVVGQFARFAEQELAPLNATGDRSGCRVENGRVVMPAGFTAAYRSYADQGWPGLSLPREYGGQGLPASLMGAVMEIFAGANHSLQMLCGLVGGAARTLLSFGTERQKHEYLPRLISGDCLATMCMTEADAGSDLSRIRTRAVPDGAAWRISGEKIFISGGDQDLSEGILHLVLARTGDHGSGTRGLSLFLCRSHEEQGRRNSIRLVRIEEKLGLHASPTCQLSFEDATAEMIGQPGEGLKAMFVMMNHARIDVALQGVAHAARACDVASEFAARRVQGRHPGSALPVSIEAHGDVRRMLQEQGTLAVSGRALCYVALVELDVGQNPGLMDFLTPVCKFYCSEGGIRAANLGIQVLGGYGYLREYGMEQVLRDARITALYEGTNGIQATTLAGRLLRQNSGSAAAAFALWIADIIANSTGPVTLALAQVNRLWVEARNRVQASDDPGAQAHAFMQLTASLACLAAWQLILTQCESGAGYPAGLPELARQQFCNLPIEAQYWSATVSL